MRYLFGPVPSRRLGMSLGVDLIPYKTCTFDCLYCEVGRTSTRISTPDLFFSADDIIFEIEKRLKNSVPDTVTLAGSGEPTLYLGIDRIIEAVKGMTTTKVAILTNGSLLWKPEVRRRILMSDIIMPTLTTAFDKTFRYIHRPHPDIALHSVIDGLVKLREEYMGQIFLELIFLSGINDSKKEVNAMKDIIAYIDPDKIQLNTVVRPPADERALCTDRRRLEGIKDMLGEKAEIITGIPHVAGKGGNCLADDILDMVKRRPLRLIDISRTMGISLDDIEDSVRGLLLKGRIVRQRYLGKTYYTGNEER